MLADEVTLPLAVHPGQTNGAGNTKNGNEYLARTFIEAANCAFRYESVVRPHYERKHKRSHHAWWH